MMPFDGSAGPQDYGALHSELDNLSQDEDFNLEDYPSDFLKRVLFELKRLLDIHAFPHWRTV